MHHTQIASCFNQLFRRTHDTCMLGGAAEPLYLPATSTQPARLYYREDFAASALHEAAHWCIAGHRRRQRVDFGYGYSPPPRNPIAQQRFFALEVRPQALEWLFADTAGVRFRPSADNLGADLEDFKRRLQSALPEVRRWCEQSQDGRARDFLAALARRASASVDTEGESVRGTG